MKKSRFTEEQIAFALKQNELGVSVEEVSRKMGISEAKLKIEAWRREYNERRPHSSLNWITPSEYALKYRETTQSTHAI